VSPRAGLDTVVPQYFLEIAITTAVRSVLEHLKFAIEYSSADHVSMRYPV